MPGQTLAGIIRRSAEAWPNRTAIVSGRQSASYAALDAASSQVANGLLAAGCAAQERIAILTRNSVEFWEIMLGCLKVGAVALPLNWRLATPEIAYILQHAGARLLFCAAEFQGLAEGVAERLILVEDAPGGTGSYVAWRNAQQAGDPQTPVLAADVALQMYTSGTTGLPKGVQLTHEGYFAALSIVRSFAWGRLDPDDVVLTPAPFFHVNGVNPVLRTFAAGAKVVAPPQFDAADVLDLIESHRVTRATLAPAMIQSCLQVAGTPERDLSSLEVISYGGSPISEQVLHEAQKLIGRKFVQMYGLTETSGPLTFLEPDDHDAAHGRLLSCGRAGPGVEISVINADGTPTPTGEVGEVRVRTKAMMKGYWRDEAATQAVLIDGWFKTGDAGCLDEDGYLYIRDRVKDMIVSGGENIYPAEVENAIFSHPAVADVAVIGVPDAKWGEAVKALVVRKPAAELNEAEVIAHARTQIAGYKVPKSITWIDEIPRNPAGKILRRRLRDPFWADAARNVA